MSTILTLIGQLVEFEQGYTSAYGCEEILTSLAGVQRQVLERLSVKHDDQIRRLDAENANLRDTIRWKEELIGDLNDKLAEVRRERVAARVADGTLIAEAVERVRADGGDPALDFIPLIKAVREISGLGLKESKDIVDAWRATQKKEVSA